MVLAADYYKHNIMFFPISWREDDQVSNVKMFRQATKVLMMLGNYVINRGEFIKSELRDKNVQRYSAEVVATNIEIGVEYEE
jgi:hypothetical protein